MMGRISLPKFDDKTSLFFGAVAGLFLISSGVFHRWLPVGIIQMLIGGVLGVHCLDMARYYRNHRLVRVVPREETEGDKKIRTRVKKPNKVVVLGSAVNLLWSHKQFVIWLAICAIGIVIGLFAGIGMTRLVILVVIACMGWAMEAANTSIELLMDIVNPEYSEKVKAVKDVFSIVPVFAYSAYVIAWLILVSPTLVERIIVWVG
jgi:diacylglycerol kinase